MGSTPQHKWAVVISLEKGLAELVTSRISKLLMAPTILGLPRTLPLSLSNPIAIMSKIGKAAIIGETTFIMVVLVKTPIVYDHLDYSFKIKEKEDKRKKRRIIFFFFSCHKKYT